jgi:hypothetical protein
MRREIEPLLGARGPKLAHLLIHAELDGVVTSGGLRGKQQTYASFAERVPEAKPVSAEEALVMLAKRFFGSRGPVTVKDFATWASLTVGDARRGLAPLEKDLESEVVDGRTYWSAPALRARARTSSPVIDLVQCYDEVVMSYTESKDVLFGGAPVPRTERTPFMHAILLDGCLVGHWRATPSGKIESSLFRKLTRPEGAAFAEAKNAFEAFKASTSSPNS